jgi:ornithine decarboxylase
MRALLTAGIRMTTLNLGGGFPATYGNPPQVQQHAAHIRAALHRHLPYPVQLLAEPGRALVADAGTLATTVIGTASRSGRSWAHLDTTAGLETDNRVRYPISDSRRSAGRRRWQLTGPGDRHDTVLVDVPLSADLRTGDHVFIHCAGAYPAGHGQGAAAPIRYLTPREVDADPSRHGAPAGRDRVYLTGTGTTDQVYLTTPGLQPHGHFQGGQS